MEAIDRQGMTPLLVTAWNRHEAVVGLLRKNRAKSKTTDASGDTAPFYMAALNENEAVVRLMLDNGVDIE